jgi:hypothetical protein
MDPAAEALQQYIGFEKVTYQELHEFSGVPLTTLWHRDHGRISIQERAALQQYLTPQEEKALVKYLLNKFRSGFPLPIKASRSLAHEIALRRPSNFQTVLCDGKIKPPGKNWAQAFHRRHPELKATRVKAINWERDDSHIYDKVAQWYPIIGEELSKPDVLAENTYNMDETGILLSLLKSLKVLVGRDDIKTYRGTGVKRTLITAIECISADGRSLDPLIIWPASTHRSSWTTHPTPGWHYAHSASGYTDSSISLYWIKNVFDPLTKERAGKKPRILINDGFGTHESLEILKFCSENNITLCRLPSHTSHKLQPCDVGVFGPLKAAYREEVEKLYRGGSDTIGKQHFTLLYDRARQKAFSQRNILAGWSKAGLRPFNPQRVLSEVQKPIVNSVSTVLTINNPNHDMTLPELPNTPVTADALSTLRKTIDNTVSNIDALDLAAKSCIRKLANAAENAFAERSILLDENLLLFQQNNERAVRVSTKATMIGNARVMKYEDILKEQELRDKKALKPKAPRGRPRLKRQQSDLTSLEPKNKQRITEREEATREIVTAGLKDYCTIIEFEPK